MIIFWVQHLSWSLLMRPLPRRMTVRLHCDNDSCIRRHPFPVESLLAEGDVVVHAPCVVARDPLKKVPGKRFE